MTSNEYTIHYKISLLDYARCSSVAAACRAFKISRTRYYEIAHDFERFGAAGLLPKPKCPKMPNKIKGMEEKAILDLALEYPTYGPARLANELKAKTDGALSYSSVGIYLVLKRNGLNRKRQRLYRSYLSSGALATLESIQRIDSKVDVHIDTSHTGELLGQDSFYLGTIKGIGRIYTQAVIDCNCSFAFAKLYSDKSSASAVDILERNVFPFYRAMNVAIERIITDNGKEYTHHIHSGIARHRYEVYLKEKGIVHSLTKVRCPETNGYVERFHRTLLDEFFLIAIRKNIYSSLAQLEDNLCRFMVEYNFRRTHQGIKLGDVVPIRKFVSGMKIPLMIESKKLNYQRTKV